MSRARDNANLSPTIPDARMPNLTGDVTTVEGAVATTIATDAVDIAMLSASGTADGDTFLRGDNAWAAAGATMQHNVLSATTATSITFGGGTPPIFLTLIMAEDSIVNKSDESKLRCFYQFYLTDTTVSSPNIYGSVSGGKTVVNDGVLSANGGGGYSSGWNVGYWEPFTDLGSYGSGDLTITFALYRSGGNNLILNASSNISSVTIIEMLA